MLCLGRRVMVVCADEELKRNVTTGEAGRFNSVPLKPGSYSVKAEAESSRLRTNESVFSRLGQKQSVSFTLKLAAA
jgi:Carboxypeptidase regulatory-like domain